MEIAIVKVRDDNNMDMEFSCGGTDTGNAAKVEIMEICR